MKFRGRSYHDYDPREKVSLAWEEAEQGDYCAVETVNALPEECFEALSDHMREHFLEMRCERDGLDPDGIDSYEVELEEEDEEEILRIIVDRIMRSLKYCTYSEKDHMLGLMAEWMATEVMNG